MLALAAGAAARQHPRHLQSRHRRGPGRGHRLGKSCAFGRVRHGTIAARAIGRRRRRLHRVRRHARLWLTQGQVERGIGVAARDLGDAALRVFDAIARLAIGVDPTPLAPAVQAVGRGDVSIQIQPIAVGEAQIALRDRLEAGAAPRSEPRQQAAAQQKDGNWPRPGQGSSQRAHLVRTAEFTHRDRLYSATCRRARTASAVHRILTPEAAAQRPAGRTCCSASERSGIRGGTGRMRPNFADRAAMPMLTERALGGRDRDALPRNPSEP
jgi:hypothetical protein